MLLVETFDQYVELLESRPELGTQEAAAELGEAAGSPGYGPFYERAALLLNGAQGADPAVAWSEYRRAADEAQARIDALQPLEAEIRAAREAGNHARTLALVDQALPVALELGFGTVACELLNERGLALHNLSTENRAAEVDAAIDAFEDGLQIATPGEQSAALLMHLGMALTERVSGDRSDNVERGIQALRAALGQLEDADDDELRAMVLTNLSVALGRAEGDHREMAAREAVAHCRAALRIRSPERDADDWAYSQLNLGEALRELISTDPSCAAEANSAFRAVLDHAGEIRDQTLVGVAHQLLGRLHMATTRRSSQDLIDAYDGGTLDQEPDTGSDLREARAHFDMARRLITSDPIRRARAIGDASDALAGLGEVEAAIEAAREALGVLGPTAVPDACKEVAWRLGWLLATRGDWPGAAAAMSTAVEAADLMFHARLDAASREREIRDAGNLHRWAAYALARAGNLRGAAVVLDAGRGREIARRLEDSHALDHVPEALRRDYEGAIAALTSSPLRGDASGASRRLQEVVAEIRTVPGHEGFGAGPGFEEVTAAVEPEWPLVYVNPSPSGTLLLALSKRAACGEVDIRSIFLEATSDEVFFRLIAGDGAREDAVEGEGASYLFGMGTGNTEEFTRALDQVLPWIGEVLGQQISELLSGLDATGVTLVVCGPLGAAPLHAASWKVDREHRYLGDRFSVRYAPSAVVCAAALRRSMRARNLRLVALADPQGDLPAARPEVQEIAALFPDQATQVAVGMQADARFLRRHASAASHLHLACHARGGLFDSSDAALGLASGVLLATDLTAATRLDARLVVASACESALSEISGLPDEVVSIGTAMLAAGSACAIASLWPVDDLATALLMTRLYQEMLTGGHRPPEALTAAQRWLREITEDEERQFVERHPQLAAEFDRRTRTARGLPGRRASDEDPRSTWNRPYEHPDFWAPFISVGA